MLVDSLLSELFKKYDIDYNLLTDEQKELIKKNQDMNQMENKLNFLFNVVGVSAKKIEQCLSILYFDSNDYEKNYNYLLNVGINKEKINGCLHVLNSSYLSLVDTYNYVSKNYGVEVFNKNVSILAIPVSRIVEMEDNFVGRVDKSTILSMAITTLRVPEIISILNVCEENGIDVTGSFFQKSYGEVSKIINICKERNVPVCSSMFKKSSDEVKKIICQTSTC